MKATKLTTPCMNNIGIAMDSSMLPVNAISLSKTNAVNDGAMTEPASTPVKSVKVILSNDQRGVLSDISGS